MVKTVTTRAKHAIKDVTQRSIEGARSVAGEALGAAATAAANVVLESTANALETGRARIRQSTPAVKQALGRAAAKTVSKPARRKTSRKRKSSRKKLKAKRRVRR